MSRIILIGYMGAGKTTVGKALANDLEMTFYDLDWYIESRMHKTVPQIFAERGEEGFRKIEHNILHEVAEFEDGLTLYAKISYTFTELDGKARNYEIITKL